MAKPKLLFVSPQFLFPMDAGGKIRTANILKRLKGGAFEVTLAAPTTATQLETHQSSIDAICDRYVYWAPSRSGSKAMRFIGSLASALPMSVWTDATTDAKAAISAAHDDGPDLVVFDYVHSASLAPEDAPGAKRIMFAHNVETEILRRQRDLAGGAMKAAFALEAAKMAQFEKSVAARMDAVIAVSERDAVAFAQDFGARRAVPIPTGVDLDFFEYAPPPQSADVVFMGSMDWRPNVDGVIWFLENVWPAVRTARPDATFRIIGKNPPPQLEAMAAASGCSVTGFVDDVRDYARAAAFVTPLLAGGGTRIKVFEAMALGAPVVSTGLGVEGLELSPGVEYLEANAPKEFAESVIALLGDHELRLRLAETARRRVEDRHSQDHAARVFERHCLDVVEGVR